MGEDVDDEIARARISMAQAMSVRSYRTKNNAEIKFDLDFDELCNRMSQEGNVNVRNFTTREFYSLFKYIKKQHRPKQIK